MPFLFLLLLTLACLPVPWPGDAVFPWVSPVRSTLLTAAAMSGVVAAAFLLARWTRRGLLEEGACREAVLHRYGRLRSLHVIGLFLIYGLAVGVLGWGWTVQHVLTAETWDQMRGNPASEDYLARMYPGVEVVILGPFLAAMLLSWASFYDVERAVHPQHREWGRWSYVGFHARQNLALILPPLALLIITQGFARRFPELQSDPIFRVGSYGLLVGFLVSMPWIFRLVLGLKPLPEGPLRDRLLQAARRLNFRCSNILLWSTRGNMANAMVVGVLPRVRYVVFTDRLVNELEPEEVEAVFGHEVGHVKHRHMLYYLGFLLISLAVVVGMWTVLFGPLDGNSAWMIVPLVPFFGAYVFVVFGFLSRRCERQADIFGCRAMSCGQRDCQGHDEGMQPSFGGSGLCATGIHTFISALEKVAQLNGISRSKPGWLSSWQHSTIARRVDFLQRMLMDPALEPRFQRTVAVVKWGLLVVLIVLMIVLLRTQTSSNAFLF